MTGSIDLRGFAVRPSCLLPAVALFISAIPGLAACAGAPAGAGPPDPSRTTVPATSTATASAPPPTQPLEPFRDDFDDAASLAAWELRQGQRHSGGPGAVSVVDGELQVVSPHASWLDQAESIGLVRTVSGDVDVTARVRTTGVLGERPDIAWSLAGIMLRDPAEGPADWIHWTVGEVGGPVLERKRTTSGRSILDLVALPDASPVDLRLIRSGDLVVLAYRQHDDPWTVAYDYTWVELPETLELILTAQSGGVGDHADLVAYTDFVDVVPTAFGQEEIALLADRDAAPLNR